MENLDPNKIPRTILKYNTIVNSDLSEFGDSAKILYISPECFIVGLNDVPYYVFVTPRYNYKQLPLNIQAGIYQTKKVVLQASFSSDPSVDNKHCIIPNWIVDFKNIEELKFDHVDLTDLSQYNDMPIKNLILSRVNFSDGDELITSIKGFSNLKDLSYDKSLPNYIVDPLTKLDIKLTVLPASD